MYYITQDIRRALESKHTHPLTKIFINLALEAPTFKEASDCLQEAYELIKDRNEQLCPHLKRANDGSIH